LPECHTLMSCCHYSQIPNTAAFEIEKKCFIHLKGNRNKNSTKTRNNSALSKRHFSWTVFRGISYSNTMHFFVSGWTESWRTQSSEEQPENNMEFELQEKNTESVWFFSLKKRCSMVKLYICTCVTGWTTQHDIYIHYT
jgi:hypothetical protein